MRHRTFFMSCAGLSMLVVAFFSARSDAFVDDQQDMHVEEVGARRSAFLSTSGSFTLSSGGSADGGNSEELTEG